jgi:hypothetical protein
MPRYICIDCEDITDCDGGEEVLHCECGGEVYHDVSQKPPRTEGPICAAHGYVVSDANGNQYTLQDICKNLAQGYQRMLGPAHVQAVLDAIDKTLGIDT